MFVEGSSYARFGLGGREMMIKTSQDSPQNWRLSEDEDIVIWHPQN